MPTNYERGAYEPVDEVRVFDGGEDEDDVEGSRLPLLIVIALLVLAAFGGVVWMAYQRGVAQGHAEIPRVIAAEPGPAKVPPTNAGGATTPYTGLKIYQQPAPSNEDADSGSAPPPPSQALPTKPRPAIAAPATPAPAPVVTKPPVKNLAATTAPPASPPSVKPPPVRTAETVQTKPVVLAPPESAPPVAAPVTGTGGLLQIGAYKSEAEANTAWTTYKNKHASLLSGTSPDVKQVDLGAKGTWYRLRIATGDKSAAAALCEKLKAEGGACFPAK